MCFIVVGKCSPFVFSIGFLSNESVGEDGSFLRVVQVDEFVMWDGMMVRSGDIGCFCCWCAGRGSLVGLLSFIMVWVESFIRLVMVIPLWSFVGEYQVM